MNFKKITLKNGARVILCPMKNTNTTTVLVLVGTGSKYEKMRNRGISHFLEHMYFKGTKKRPNPILVSNELDSVGAEYNAFTTKEVTGYYVKVDNSNFELSLDVVSDILLNSLFDQKEIDKEKNVIIEEMNMYKDAPHRRIHDLFNQLLWGNQPSGWDVIGVKKTIEEFKRNDFIDYLKSQYRGKSIVIVASGNFGKQNVLKKIKKYFRNLRNGRAKPKPKLVERQKKPFVKIEYKETKQTHLILGVKTYNMFHKDKYALSLLAVILGGFMSSRLFVKIREQMGAAYYIRTDSDLETDCGSFFTAAGVSNNKVLLVISEILKEYKEIAKNGVATRELEKAKKYIKGKIMLGLESSDEVANFLGEQELFENKILKPKEILKKINKIKIEDIQRVAKDIFVKEKLNIALIGPWDKNFEKKLLKNILRF